MTYNIPDQRVSSSVKKTKDWYTKMADFVIGLAISSDDKTKVRDFLDAANGELKFKDYAYVLSTYGSANEQTDIEAVLDSVKLGRLRDVDILTPIKDKYMGEFINSYHNYQVYGNDIETVIKMNNAFGAKVTDKMFEKLQQLLESQDGQSNINIQDFITKSLQETKDKLVGKEQFALELLNTEIEAKRKYNDAYFYWWSCEQVYTYRKLVGNSVYFDVISPLEYYRVDSGNFFVEDDNYGLRRYELTIHEIIDYFYNGMEDGLTDDQVRLLEKLATSAENGIATINDAVIREFDGHFEKDVRGVSRDFTKQGLKTNVDHYVFKTLIPVGILKYTAANGEEAEMEVDENYVLDIANGDISIDWIYKDQVWEGWRFGINEGTFVYIPVRPVDLQRELVNNHSVCKLPYNGISYIHKDNVSKPIPYRIKDNIALYKIYTLLEEKWINKFKSWLLFPETILSDSSEMSATDRLQQADIDSVLPFNDAKIKDNPTALNMFKELATTAVVEFIKILNSIKESIKQSAWELANMNDARFGQTNPYKTKGGTEYDYNQAIKGTVWSLEAFNSFREKDYMANLDYSRAAWIDGKNGSYVDPNTGETITVNIDGEEHLGANVGIYIANSAELNAQANDLKQIALGAVQNDNPEIAAEIITNKNISKLKSIIKEVTTAKRDFELKMSTAKEEAMAKVKEIELTNDREKREHEKYIADSKNETTIQAEIIRSETEIAIEEARLEIDTNGNGYIDKAEADGSKDEIVSRAKAVDRLQARKDQVELLKMGQQNLARKQQQKNITKK